MKISELRADEIIRKMWADFGISIVDTGSYSGFIKNPSYDIWFPRLDENGEIVSLRREYCDVVHLHYFSDVKRFISRKAKNEPEYFRLCYKSMRVG